jgi:hypothetical protein
MPIEVTVVAWQWGRAVPPLLQSSEPITRSFQIHRSSSASGFAHPGMLHTAADLKRMKQHLDVGEEPWESGFEQLQRNRYSQTNWRLQGPFEHVRRDPRDSVRNDDMVADANAAYQNALMWCITGDEEHAQKAVEILDAWSRTLKKLDGRDVQLAAGLNGFKFANAAELIRATYPAWSAADIEQFERWLRTVIYPPIQDFATFANGNWDAACIKTMLAIGVFCDDREIFERAIEYYRHGTGNGSITNYVINETGQCQESGRDQQHAQLGLACLAEACEIAWNQGVDLYGAVDNRLLKGFEYTSRYLLGEDVPFVEHTDTTGKYRVTSISSRGRHRLRPVHEMVWNHYEHRVGIKAPYTRKAAERIRPEGAAHGADHPGFGTVLFAREPLSQTAVHAP